MARPSRARVTQRRSGWHTIELNGTVPDDELIELVDASYDDVGIRLPKSRCPPVG